MCRTFYSSLCYSNGYFSSVQLFKSFAPLNGPFPTPHSPTQNSNTTTRQFAVHISPNICISSLPCNIKSLPLVHSPSMDNANNTCSISVQRVNKKSSDELLKKFADDEPAPLRFAKRRKRREGGSDSCESPNSHSLTERRSLLPPVTSKSALLRQFRIGKSRLRARGIKNKSLFGTLEKTWRKTIEGASRVFMEKHYNRHRRLINDVV